MSASAESITSSPPEPAWAKPGVGALNFVIFLAVFVLAYLAKMENLLLILAGISGANVTTVVNYYFGSSSGSARKTSLLAASPSIQPNP